MSNDRFKTVWDVAEYLHTHGEKALARKPKKRGKGNREAKQRGRASRRRGRAATMTGEQAVKVFRKNGTPLVSGDGERALKKKYRALALRLHPDVRPEAEKKRATKDLVELNAAYGVLVKTIGEGLQAAAKAGKRSGFDYDAWYEEAMSETSRAAEDASKAAEGWQPPGDVKGVGEKEFLAWARDVIALGAVRVQLREYVPHDPAYNPFSLYGTWGYSGSVIKTRTLRGTPTAEDLAAAVLSTIAGTAPRWKGSPLELITRLTIHRTEGAVAWVAGQDWSGHMFGYRTRWHSLSVTRRPERKKRVPKAEKMSRPKVEALLRAAGMTVTNPRAWKATKWVFDGATRSYRGYEGRTVSYQPELETKDKLVRGGPGDKLLYYGKMTAVDVQALIEWAKGTER